MACEAMNAPKDRVFLSAKDSDEYKSLRRIQATELELLYCLMSCAWNPNCGPYVNTRYRVEQTITYLDSLWSKTKNIRADGLEV